ncbi:MAG: hypothetical protein RIC24_00295 [Hyphomicrobiales bacterium]|jgi:hypothetical protein
MVMVPVSSASAAQKAASTGQTVASAGARVAPVPGAAGVSGATAGGAAVVLGAPTAGLPQQITTQALMTLLQTLGKPLSGSVAQAPQGAPGAPAGGGSTNLSVTLTVPQSATSTAGGTISTSLPLPTGSAAPPAGTPVTVQAEGSPNAPRIAVTVTGAAPTSPDSLRADAARQSSLAPLLADVAKLAGQPTTGSPAATKNLDAALGRILGFSLDADMPLDANTLRSAIEGARTGPLTGSNAPQSTASQTPMQSALGALARALGMVLPAVPEGNAQAQTQGTQQASQQGAQQLGSPKGDTAGARPTPPPLPDGAQPSRLLAHPLSSDAPDLTDPAVLQTLKGKAEAALSRLNLLQAGDQTAARAGEAGSSLRWDVPFLIGQEAAVLGVVIDQDDASDARDDERLKSWRFRFAFESQVLGGVEGLVALHSQTIKPEADPHLDIAVWASEPSVRARLEATRYDLVKRLQTEGLQIDSLTIAPTDDLPKPNVVPDHEQTHRVDLFS